MNSGRFKHTEQFWCESALIVFYAIPIKHVQLSMAEPTTRFQNISNICEIILITVSYSNTPLVVQLFWAKNILLTLSVSLSPSHRSSC